MKFGILALLQISIVLSLPFGTMGQGLAQTDSPGVTSESWVPKPAVGANSGTTPSFLFDSAPLFNHPTGATRSWPVMDSETLGRISVPGENGRWREFQTGRDELSWRLRRITRREHLLAAPNAPQFVIWDEDYQDSRDRGWGAESNFQQSRSFAGLSWRSSSKDRLQMELGYLNQTWDEPGPDDRRFHFFSLNFFY